MTKAEPGGDRGAGGDRAGDGAASAVAAWGFWISVVGLPVAGVLLWKFDIARPGSLLRSGVRALPPVPWTVWLAGAVLVFLAAPLGGVIALAVTGTEFPTKYAHRTHEVLRAQGIYTIGAYVAAVGAAIALCVLVSRLVAGGVRASWLSVSARDPVRGVIGLCAALPFVNVMNMASAFLYERFTHTHVSELAHETLEAMKSMPGDSWVWVQVGAAVIAAPIVEEVLYRGMLQTAALQLTGRASVAIGASSILFALSHATVSPWYAWPALGVLGAALGFAYERTKSLGVPIVMHMGFNALNVAMAALV